MRGKALVVGGNGFVESRSADQLFLLDEVRDCYFRERRYDPHPEPACVVSQAIRWSFLVKEAPKDLEVIMTCPNRELYPKRPPIIWGDQEISVMRDKLS